MLDTFSKSLLGVVKDEYRLTERQTEKLQSLMRAGLSFEQVALASGLLGRDAYYALLEIVSGLPVEPAEALEPMPLVFFTETDMRRFRCVPYRKQKSSVTVGFSLPEAGLISQARRRFSNHGLQMIPVAMTESAFKRSLGSEKRMSARTVLRDLVRYAERNGRFHLRLLGTDGVLRVTDDLYQSDEASPRLSVAVLSSVMLHVKRRGDASPWKIDYEHAGTHPVLHLTRTGASDRHPTAWTDRALQERIDEPALTVLVRHDPYVDRQIEDVDCFGTCKEWGGDRVKKYNAMSREEQELVIHAALAGERVLAASDDVSDWWEPVSLAGIPVKVYRAHVSPAGRAWEVWEGSG